MENSNQEESTNQDKSNRGKQYEAKEAVIKLNGVTIGTMKELRWEHPVKEIKKPSWEGHIEFKLSEEEVLVIRDKLGPNPPMLFDVEMDDDTITLVKRAFEEKFPAYKYEPMFVGNTMVGVSIVHNLKQEEE